MIYDDESHHLDTATSMTEAITRDRKLWPGGITTEVAYTYEKRSSMNSARFLSYLEIEHRKQYDKFLEMNEPVRAVTYSAGSITLNNGSTIQGMRFPGQVVIDEFFSARGANQFRGASKLHKVFSQRPRRATK